MEKPSKWGSSGTAWARPLARAEQGSRYREPPPLPPSLQVHAPPLTLTLPYPTLSATAPSTLFSNFLCFTTADRDMSDKNVYCDPYTAELLPLDGDYEGAEVSLSLTDTNTAAIV